jgi:hypothetical protein
MSPDHSPLRPLRLAALPVGDRGRTHAALDGRGPPAGAAVRLRLALLLAAAVAAVALWAWSASSDTRAVRQLPAPERAALVQRSRDNLREVCAGAAGRPREFCRAQASLLLALPECGPACQAEARRELLADSAVK